MPNYDYKCTSCGNVFEIFHGMTESPQIHCPDCSAPATKKIGAGAGIVFKGSGFYVTDYKNKQNDSGTSASSGKTSAASSPEKSTGEKPPESPKPATTDNQKAS